MTEQIIKTTREELGDTMNRLRCVIKSHHAEDHNDIDTILCTLNYLNYFADLLDRFPRNSKGEAVIPDKGEIERLLAIEAGCQRLGDGVVAAIGDEVWGVGHSGAIFGPIIIAEIQGNGLRGCEQNGRSIYVTYTNAFSTLAGAEARVKELKGGE